MRDDLKARFEKYMQALERISAEHGMFLDSNEIGGWRLWKYDPEEMQFIRDHIIQVDPRLENPE